MAGTPSTGPGRPGGSADRPATWFATAAEFEDWLERHHDYADELWMEMRGARHPERGLTWADAVPVALCFGWIDSVSQRVHDTARRQRWTPHRKRSTWSQVNIDHVARLEAQGRMRPAGRAAFEARPSSAPAYSYESGEVELDEPTAAVLAPDPVALRFVERSRDWYRLKTLHWVMSAKRPQTRLGRAEQLREASARGELVGPLAPAVTPAWVARLHAEVLAECGVASRSGSTSAESSRTESSGPG